MENIIKDYIEANREQICADLLSVLKIVSVEGEPQADAPFGVEVRDALRAFAVLGEKMGFNAECHGGWYTTIDWGEVKKPYQALGILAHADVVPVGEGWLHDFAGELCGDVIFGRGALDDKGPAIAALHALKALKDSGFVPSRPIRLLIGGNEESGSRCIERYNEENVPLWGGYSPDGHFPVIFAEKGICHWRGSRKVKSDCVASISAGTVVNAVPGKAVAVVTGETVTALGKAAHGSTPEQGDNAIRHLIALIKEKCPDDVLLAALAELERLFLDYTGAGCGLAGSDEVSGALTLNLGVLKYDGETLSFAIDIRYPVTHEFAIVAEKLEEAAKGWEITCSAHKPPLYVPKTAPLVAELLQVYRELKDESAEPIAIGGGTYCREMENFVAFGPLVPGEPDSMHQVDENITIQQLEFLLLAQAVAISRLAD